MEKLNFNPVIPFEGFQRYYNLTDKRYYAITMDIDWASEEILEWTFDWFVSHEIPITVFATHDSEVVLKYHNNPLVEIGIHPNFSKSIELDQKVNQLMNTYPFALGSRSHRNIMGRDFSDALKRNNLKYDASQLLWDAEYAEVYPLYNHMVEIPYVWEDGVHLELNQSSDHTLFTFESRGLKILNIHPVLFYLNHTSFTELKKFTGKHKELNKVSFTEYQQARRKEYGIGDFSKQIFLNLQKKDYVFYHLKDIALPAFDVFRDIYKKQNPNWG